MRCGASDEKRDAAMGQMNPAQGSYWHVDENAIVKRGKGSPWRLEMRWSGNSTIPIRFF